ncbi:Histone-lysine N-methyltransferase SETMAR [Eumeta japonica]|uniref:Histone-lysine N-methyltransferase SETMAR n=1 Tax=Eumeta variegata TaxID=151549 RepID=A0A4C1ZJJ1_EUMVA|nr:Histone-lysine N-methyltransferase SETMAR [Eumeta japonica]
MLLQHDNARPRTAKVTRDEIEELGGIELVMHPTFSPDVAPSDYYSFRSMAKFFRGRNLNPREILKMQCGNSLTQNPRNGIPKISESFLNVGLRP